MNHPESIWTRRFGWLVIAASGFSALAIALLHVLQPDMNPMQRTISEYVHGPSGFLMTATFFSQCLGSLAMAGAVVALGLKQRKAVVGCALFVVAAAGAATAGLFPADLGAQIPETGAGSIHAAGGLIRFLSLAVALPLLSSALKTQPQFQRAARSLTALATVYVVVLIASIFVLANLDLFGLGQRCFIATLLVWLIVAANAMVQHDR